MRIASLILSLLLPGMTGRAAEPLRRAADVLALSPSAARAGRAAELRGVVTYVKPGGYVDLVIQDESAGIFVGNVGRLPPLELKPGMAVEVKGRTTEGGYAPTVQAYSIRVTGTNALPTPAHVTFDDIRSGRFPSQFVEVEGVVRSASVDRHLPPARLILKVATPAGLLDAWVLDFGEETGLRFVDASVRLKAVCLYWANARKQPFSQRLLVNNPAAIELLSQANADPFLAPLVPLAEMLRFRPDGANLHRVRVRAVCTLHQPGEWMAIQEGALGLRVRLSRPAALKVGDEVEVVGFPAISGYTAELQDAVVRVVKSGVPLTAPLSESRQLLRSQLLNDVDARLVRLQGRIASVLASPGQLTLHLADQGVSFLALLPAAGPEIPPATLQPGGLVELTGVCELQASERTHLKGAPPDSFVLHLRSADDLKILRRGPWLTVRRLLLVLGVGAGGLVFALVWAFELRRRVETRTALLAKEIRARHDAEIEFNAVLGERGRVAGELHDTLEQELTGVALQLEAAKLSLAVNPSRLGQHVDMAGQLLQRSRDDVRKLVWDLHTGTQREADLMTQLHEVLGPMELKNGRKIEIASQGEVRPLGELTANHLLRIAQEAVANAVKHADANTIRVEATYEADGVRLKVADDGAGFEAADAPGPESGHFGLSGMRDRVKRLGGTLTVESTVKRGTSVQVWAPIQGSTRKL